MSDFALDGDHKKANKSASLTLNEFLVKLGEYLMIKKLSRFMTRSMFENILERK